MDKRWIVLKDQQHMQASVRHVTLDDAISEARRLASASSSDSFLVAEIVGYARTVTPASEYIELEASPTD